MSSLVPFLNATTLSLLLYLLIIFAIALLVNRFLRVLTNILVKPAQGTSRSELAREQQTRTLAGVLYSAASKIVWVVALLTALDKIGINPLPALTLGALASVAIGFGAQHLVRDVISGVYIVLEDQYAVGDTVQIGETTGRVEHLTLRRTVLRDTRGGLVTIANGDIRTVANLSRDWSQAFVDVSLAPETPLAEPLAALEAAAAEMRGDAAWSQALVDGPRVLGVQSYGREAAVVRLQVKTVPTRQDEIARELRRRVQLEFQKEGIPMANAVRVEVANPQALPGAGTQKTR
ncbi:MAG TPA: mechanosensitive ion channel domain-containing protein [Dongiaceae bacterium]|nr:mechanosensitive ion channel domain-containing protein [Dongiaceae bacterium]